MRKVILLCTIYVCCLHGLSGQMHGQVVDEKGEPLIGATILLVPDSTITVTATEGKFSLPIVGSELGRTIYTSYMGYKTDTTILNSASRDVYIKLFFDTALLQTVIISEEHAKLEATLQAVHLNKDFINKNLEGNLSQTLEKLPGLSAINIGVGIAKPVIRGLSSNRIIVNHQGIKQESQQWGADHGLEIDQFDVERLEIIKGPGSLQYGSDGLGGVINILPDVILPKNSFSGSLSGVYKTNNEHWGGSVKLGVNVQDWFLTARYSKQDFADYQVPSNLFIYNNFELPILNNRLKNTAGDETNLSISTGVKRKWGVTRLLYSHYTLEAGLFSGAVGVPRSYALVDDGNYRDIDVPSQKVNHFKLFLNQTFFLGDNHLVFDFGLQRNKRKEFSEPEFHSIPLSQLKDPNDKLALGLLLETMSLGSHYEHHREDIEMKTIIGVNSQWQQNKRTGFEYLLPNFRTFRGGIYTILEKHINAQWLVNGGLRLDLGQNNTEYYRQYIWNSNESIIDSLESPKTNDIFRNWSASLGTNLSLYEGKWVAKANLGKSFRVPYPAETVSNGIHHGTFRHEVGTPNLDSEHGYQIDLSLDWNFHKFKGTLSMYFNYFDNYIYLGPTFPARFSRLPEAGQIFQYRQDDAIYTGFEIQWDWDVSSAIEIHQGIDFVQSYNPKTKLALPFTPQPSLKTDINVAPYENTWLKDLNIEFSHQYHLAASGNLRLDRSEKATPAYQLFGLGVGSSFLVGKQTVHVRCRVQNIFNTKYLAHLSRYRIINVPEQGRNFVLALNIPFSHQFNTHKN